MWERLGRGRVRSTDGRFLIKRGRSLLPGGPRWLVLDTARIDRAGKPKLIGRFVSLPEAKRAIERRVVVVR